MMLKSPTNIKAKNIRQTNETVFVKDIKIKSEVECQTNGTDFVKNAKIITKSEVEYTRHKKRQKVVIKLRLQTTIDRWSSKRRRNDLNIENIVTETKINIVGIKKTNSVSNCAVDKNLFMKITENQSDFLQMTEEIIRIHLLKAVLFLSLNLYYPQTSEKDETVLDLWNMICNLLEKKMCQTKLQSLMENYPRLMEESRNNNFSFLMITNVVKYEKSNCFRSFVKLRYEATDFERLIKNAKEDAENVLAGITNEVNDYENTRFQKEIMCLVEKFQSTTDYRDTKSNGDGSNQATLEEIRQTSLTHHLYVFRNYPRLIEDLRNIVRLSRDDDEKSNEDDRDQASSNGIRDDDEKSNEDDRDQASSEGIRNNDKTTSKDDSVKATQESNRSIPITLGMLRRAAADAGSEIEHLFNGELAEDQTLGYITVHPDDIRMVIDIPATLRSELMQIARRSSKKVNGQRDKKEEQ